jgi:hypothetical protein
VTECLAIVTGRRHGGLFPGFEHSPESAVTECPAAQVR